MDNFKTIIIYSLFTNILFATLLYSIFSLFYQLKSYHFLIIGYYLIV